MLNEDIRRMANHDYFASASLKKAQEAYKYAHRKDSGGSLPGNRPPGASQAAEPVKPPSAGVQGSPELAAARAEAEMAMEVLGVHRANAKRLVKLAVERGNTSTADILRAALRIYYQR